MPPTIQLHQTMGEFAAATRDSFAFLLELGFRETVADALFPRRPIGSVSDLPLAGAHMRFQRIDAAVDVYNDPRAEIQIVIHPALQPAGRGIDLNEILAGFDVPTTGDGAWLGGGIFSSGETRVAIVLAAAARGVREYALPFLLGRATF